MEISSTCTITDGHLTTTDDVTRRLSPGTAALPGVTVQKPIVFFRN